MLRYSLATLMSATAFIAIGCTALLYPNEIWDQTTFSASAVLLLLVTVRAIFGRRSRRPFCVGFVLFGAAYFFLAMNTANLWWIAAHRHRMLTTSVLNVIQQAMHEDLPLMPVNIQGANPANDWRTVAHFQNIGHSLCTVIIGFIGGVVASIVSQRSSRHDVAKE